VGGTVKKRIRLVLTLAFFGYSGYKAVSVIGGLLLGSMEGGDQGKFAPAAGDPISVVVFAALYLALPLHLTCVGLLMQRPYLPSPWPRIVWWAVVFSGLWVGTSFLIRKFG
jgi:hypothetical protein